MRRYRLDIEESEISWTGFQPSKEISGKIYFSAGMICTANSEITEAEFIIDMRSITYTEDKLTDEKKIKLIRDLKSINFFNVDVYPKSILKTKEIKPLNKGEIDSWNAIRITNPTHEVTVALTIKDITHEIKFPVKITFINNHINADAQINIDRSLWNINFMLEESYGEQKINPGFLVDVKIIGVGIDEIGG